MSESMVHLVCPMCGRLVSLRHFDPSTFGRDIFVKEIKGKGRGKGFGVVRAYSILNNNLTVARIRERCLSILSLLLSTGLVGEDYVVGKLGLSVHDEPVREEPSLPVRDPELEEVAENLEKMVYDVMDLNPDDIDDNEDITVRLNRAVTKLVKDYADFRDAIEV